jgi:Domain of unknown function (DUF4091)
MSNLSKAVLGLGAGAIIIACTYVRPQRVYAKRYLQALPRSAQAKLSPTLNRVHSNEFPSLGITEITMLRGDTANVQLVVASGASSQKISDLQIDVLSGIKTKLYEAKTLSILKPSGEFGRDDTVRSEGAGNYPDRLVPMTNTVVAANSSTTFWVEIETESNIKPGSYNLNLHWKIDEVEQQKTLTLIVLDSSFPTSPNFGNLVVVWQKEHTETLQLLSDHRLSPTADQASLFTPARTPKFWGTKIWSHANVSSRTMDSAPAAWTIIQRKGLIPKGATPLNYTADEIDGKSELFDEVEKWGEALHLQGVKNLVVMTPTQELLKQPLPVDIFVSLPRSFVDQAGAISMAKKAGAETWVYTATNQDPYSPKWLLDFPAPNFRALCGAYANAIGATGTVYWAADKYTPQPLKSVAYEHPNGEPYHGDGVLVYPSEKKQKGSVDPSCRLKWIRDGILDYELLSRLSQSEAKRVRSIVVSNAQVWSQNPSDWQRFHTQLRRAYALAFPSPTK